MLGNLGEGWRGLNQELSLLAQVGGLIFFAFFLDEYTQPPSKTMVSGLYG